MEKVMLAAEAVIGLMGVLAIVNADGLHDRVHGVFVILLSLQGICDHLLGVEHIVTEILLFATAAAALVVAALSLRHVAHRVMERKRAQKQETMLNE